MADLSDTGAGTGGIPQSNALAEASPDSLAELFSRDPEGLQEQDLVKLIEALRAQRARMAEADRTKQATPKAKAGGKAASLVASINPGELDL